jgi:ABC-2 type transport system ATP-binding protein/lipopolysaccharide transport system ATP-binding protein
MSQLIDRSSIMVVASHSDVMIRDLCTKGALMEKGRLVMIGPVDEVLEVYHRGLS